MNNKKTLSQQECLNKLNDSWRDVEHWGETFLKRTLYVDGAKIKLFYDDVYRHAFKCILEDGREESLSDVSETIQKEALLEIKKHLINIYDPVTNTLKIVNDFFKGESNGPIKISQMPR